MPSNRDSRLLSIDFGLLLLLAGVFVLGLGFWMGNSYSQTERAGADIVEFVTADFFIFFLGAVSIALSLRMIVKARKEYHEIARTCRM